MRRGTSGEAPFIDGPGAVAVLDPINGRVDVTVPDSPSDWPRFWKQFAIFVGTAGLLAL